MSTVVSWNKTNAGANACRAAAKELSGRSGLVSRRHSIGFSASEFFSRCAIEPVPEIGKIAGRFRQPPHGCRQ
jgi:hypothetical protein